MKQPNGQVAGHRCDDRLPKADGNVEERRDATKAIIQKEYGPPDVLELGDIERPEIGDGEVLVRVRAAGVDRGVWHLMKGMPYLLRLFGYGLRAPKIPVPGMDLAGIVEAVGENVSRVEPGDEVFGVGKGAFAEYALAREAKLAPRPANLTFEEAAVLAISGLTALQGLRDHGRVEPGAGFVTLPHSPRYSSWDSRRTRLRS
jgi:NADPH:quinone reductase-like Zn-dependent oxidoreductase